MTIDGNGATVQATTSFGSLILMSNGSPGLLSVNALELTGGSVAGFGGGIATFGAVTVTGSTITNNQSTAPGTGGGGIAAGGAVTMTDSTISNNKATGAGSGGGGIAAFGAVKVTGSTIDHNSVASGFGGGIDGPAVTVTNSTIANNSENGTSGSHGGGGVAGNPVTLVYATVVQNTSSIGANVSSLTSMMSFGSVIAVPHGLGMNCAGTTPTSHGFNLEDDAGASCGFSTGTGDLAPGTDSMLGAVSLANNGGSTLTLLPPSGSPLVDAIPNADCGDGNTLAGFTITTDQIGTTRPQGPACDIGALEVPTALSATSGSDQSTPTGVAFANPLVITVTYSNGMLVAGDAVTCSAPGSGASATFSGTGTNTETDVTNASGIATTSTLTANSVGGTYSVTCTGSGTATFTLTNLAATPASAVTTSPALVITPLFTG